MDRLSIYPLGAMAPDHKSLDATILDEELVESLGYEPMPVEHVSEPDRSAFESDQSADSEAHAVEPELDEDPSAGENDANVGANADRSFFGEAAPYRAPLLVSSESAKLHGSRKAARDSDDSKVDSQDQASPANGEASQSEEEGESDRERAKGSDELDAVAPYVAVTDSVAPDSVVSGAVVSGAVVSDVDVADADAGVDHGVTTTDVGAEELEGANRNGVIVAESDEDNGARSSVERDSENDDRDLGVDAAVSNGSPPSRAPIADDESEEVLSSEAALIDEKSWSEMTKPKPADGEGASSAGGLLIIGDDAMLETKPRDVPEVEPAPQWATDERPEPIAPAVDRDSPPQRSSNEPGRPATRTQGSRRRRRSRLRARKTRRVVRHVDPWSVMVFSMFFHLCFFAALLIASVLVWNAAVGAGTIENIENFIRELGDYERFEIDSDAVFRSAMLIAGIMTLASTIMVVLLTVVFNLISDLVGGIRVTVIEEETMVRGGGGNASEPPPR